MPDKDPSNTASTSVLRLLDGRSGLLRVISGPEAGREIHLPLKITTMGSHQSAEILLADPLMSKIHFQIQPKDGWWYVRDLNSENGTFLNDILILESAILPGEVLLAGNSELVFNLDDSAGEGWVKQKGEWVEIPRIIAHELKNYMQFLDVGVEHLRRDPDVESRYPGEIRTLVMAKEQIEELVHSLRAGCVAPRKKILDLREILWEQLMILESVAEDLAIKLIPEISGEKTEVMGDPQQLGRCFLNLIKNAFEACKQGDHVRVGLECEKDWVIVRISDTGCGMDNEVCEAMWTPLFTTKDSGNGLGSFIARTIIVRHQGLIEVKSELHKGTIISIQIPRQG